ncbi:hypothetical protein [Flavobacterium sp.]|uniref:hypothetical protein n=1 Tax=Flavobacterium sp. TaxID=239 RepID=UPI0026282CC2|nr:hypothetical protein [Flavobacterium sp.]
MKKNILLLFAIVLAFNSCAPGEDTPTPEPTDPSEAVLLKKTITTKGSVVTTDIYSYNGKKIDKIVSSNGTNNNETKFTYTADLITKIEVFSNDILKSKKELTYQSDILKEIITYEYTDTETTKKRTTYVKNGSEETYFYNIYRVNMSNNEETIITDGVLEYFADELQNHVNTDYPIIAGRYNDTYAQYEYDVKKNPTINIIGNSKLLNNVLMGDGHNMSKKTFTYDVYENGAWAAKTVVYRRTHTYDSLRFPIERKVLTKDGALDYTVQFFYE